MKVWIPSVVALLGALVAGQARATNCSNDVDCDCGQVCSFNTNPHSCVAADGGDLGWCEGNADCIYQGQTCSAPYCVPAWAAGDVCTKATGGSSTGAASSTGGASSTSSSGGGSSTGAGASASGGVSTAGGSSTGARGSSGGAAGASASGGGSGGASSGGTSSSGTPAGGCGYGGAPGLFGWAAVLLALGLLSATRRKRS